MTEPMDEHHSRSPLDADEAAALQALGWRAAGGEDCPDSSLLLAAAEGVLDDDLASRVRTHLETCPTCRQLTRDLAEVLSESPTTAEADRIGARIDKARTPAGGRVYWWFGAAGVALAAGLAWVIVVPQPSSAPVPDVELARATPVPVPSVFVVDRPAMPSGEIELTLRGEAPVKASLEMQIAAALDQADAGAAAAALATVEAAVRDHRESPAAALALGAVQLRLDRNADAVAALERARTLTSDREHADEVGWFLGIALVRTGNRDRARVLLDDVCKHGGPRSAQACAGVAELSRVPATR